MITMREKPLQLLWLEALMRRLLKDDVEFHYYQEQYRRLAAGFAGEQKLIAYGMNLYTQIPFCLT